MASMSPTQRTLQWCRQRGWIAGVVEKWIPHTRRRLDLFGFIDVVAVGDGLFPYGIQTTSGSHLANRIAKATALPTTQMVSKCFRLLFVGWRQVGDRGKRKRWRPRVIELQFVTTPRGVEAKELEWSDVGN